MSIEELLISLAVFVLAIFVGYLTITRVPPTLHTPLMSGSNAISGIVIVGAIIVAGTVRRSSRRDIGSGYRHAGNHQRGRRLSRNRPHAAHVPP